MSESTIRYEDENGRVRHQPVDREGRRFYRSFLLEQWASSPGLAIFPPAKFRSRRRAERIARRRNRHLGRVFHEVDD